MADETRSAAICSACPVVNGACPHCGTFYFTRADGKRFGIRHAPVPLHTGTNGPISLDLVANAFRCAA